VATRVYALVAAAGTQPQAGPTPAAVPYLTLLRGLTWLLKTGELRDRVAAWLAALAPPAMVQAGKLSRDDLRTLLTELLMVAALSGEETDPEAAAPTARLTAADEARFAAELQQTHRRLLDAVVRGCFAGVDADVLSLPVTTVVEWISSQRKASITFQKL